jgi:phenylalanyl-tRNA synthetase beta chain
MTMALRASAASSAASLSGCTVETVDVLIESALWDEDGIAATGRKLGVNTDARYRFERGVDYDFMMPGLEMATSTGAGPVRRGTIRGHCRLVTVPDSTHVVEFPYSEVKRLSGIDVVRC